MKGKRSGADAIWQLTGSPVMPFKSNCANDFSPQVRLPSSNGAIAARSQTQLPLMCALMVVQNRTILNDFYQVSCSEQTYSSLEERKTQADG